MLLTYAIKSAIILVLFYICLVPMLEKETFHRFNRVCILASIVASFAIPFLQLGGYSHSKVAQMIVAELPEIVVGGNAHEAQAAWSWTDIANAIYIIGVAVMLIVTVVQTIRLLARLHRAEHKADGKGNTIVITDNDISPFCFFRYIVMSRDDYEHNSRFILTHEQEHIRLRHSLDLTVLTAATALQWYNPFIWLMGKELKAIHEFEADEAVINKGIDATQYQKFLVVKAVGNRLQPFANNLNRGSLKRRIIMMNRKKSNRWMMLKALFVVPVAAVAVSAFAMGNNIVNNESTAIESMQAKHKARVAQTTKVFETAEVMPEFTGGKSALMSYLAKNLKYPASAAKAKKQGKAVVGFIVDQSGNIKDVKVMKSAGNAELDAEAIRVVKAMPKWTPGTIGGKAVDVKYSLPVQFRLK